MVYLIIYILHILINHVTRSLLNRISIVAIKYKLKLTSINITYWKFTDKEDIVCLKGLEGGINAPVYV